MKKEDSVRRYGEEEYERRLEKNRDWSKRHPTLIQVNSRKWDRKGGKFYERKREYDQMGLRRERNVIRAMHGEHYRPYKQIIAPASQIHHQWIPGTANYTGVALVEKDRHMQGFIDVIQILEGEITLLTEAEVRRGAG